MIFAKSSGQFTKCFGGQVHQALCLCSEETWGPRATFPVMDRVLSIFVLAPYMLKTYLGKNVTSHHSELKNIYGAMLLCNPCSQLHSGLSQPPKQGLSVTQAPCLHLHSQIEMWGQGERLLRRQSSDLSKSDSTLQWQSAKLL